MPKRTLRPCLAQPCPNLVESGRCSEHARRQQYQQDHSGTREREFYWSPEWRATRDAFLAANPLCQVCLAKTPPEYHLADVVDHKVPIRHGGARLDWSNLQGLCTSEHNRKTRSEMTTKA